MITTGITGNIHEISYQSINLAIIDVRLGAAGICYIQRSKQLPLIVTGYAAHISSPEWQELGDVVFLKKPIGERDLMNAVYGFRGQLKATQGEQKEQALASKNKKKKVASRDQRDVSEKF